jgi:Cys-rich protein (TIGR01571 family)
VSWFLPCVTYGRNRARYQALAQRVRQFFISRLPVKLTSCSEYCKQRPDGGCCQRRNYQMYVILSSSEPWLSAPFLIRRRLATLWYVKPVSAIHPLLTVTLGCGWVFGMQGRAETRSRYRIRGDGASDCFLSCCCAPCALTQVGIIHF